MNDSKAPYGAGGTPGGLGHFLFGLVCAGSGIYMLGSRTVVSTGYYRFWGMDSFGMAMLPFLMGLGILFFGGRALLGWALVAVGGAIIGSSIIMNLHIYFRATSLFDTLFMFGLVAAGLGMVAKSLRSM